MEIVKVRAVRQGQETSISPQGVEIHANATNLLLRRIN